jgi:hypothetical protein
MRAKARHAVLTRKGSWEHMKPITGLGLAIAVAALLIGCTTSKAIIQRYEQQCKDYGFKPNTDAMARCVQKLDTPS